MASITPATVQENGYLACDSKKAHGKLSYIVSPPPAVLFRALSHGHMQLGKLSQSYGQQGTHSDDTLSVTVSHDAKVPNTFALTIVLCIALN